MIIKTNILTPVSPAKVEFHKDVYIHIQGTKIARIRTEIEAGLAFEDKTHYICIPGLIDMHVHLSQYFTRGRYRASLLEWLNEFIFAEELKSQDPEYALKTANAFFTDSLSKGTTTSVIYTSIFPEACDIAFQTAEQFGVRAIIGKTMMDCNSPEYLQENTDNSIMQSIDLYEKWNNKTPLLEYIFTPRFAPTCSRELMRETGTFAKKNKAYIQSHLSENKKEIDWVRSLYFECSNYTEVYEKYNLLSPKTIMGHCIHLSDEELDILMDTDTKIAHCPDSNFFLKSGRFPVEKIKEYGIKFGLATDVAAGTSLSMLEMMKIYNYRQDDYIVSPQEAFYYATLGAADALGKIDLIGSVEETKEADLVFVEIDQLQAKSDVDILSDLMFIIRKKEIKEVFIAGRKASK